MTQKYRYSYSASNRMPSQRLDYSTAMKSIVAGWREFRDHPLPCIGLLETTNGFTPFTGRRHQHSLTLPAIALSRDISGITAVIGAHRQQRLLNFETDQIDCQQILLLDQQIDPDSHPEATTGDPQSLESERRNTHSRGPLYPAHLQDQRLIESSSDLPALRLLRPQGSNSYTSREHLHFTTSGRSLDFAAKPLSLSLNLAVQSPDMTDRFHNSPPLSPLAISTSSSLFTITPRDATSLVRSIQKENDSRHCYFIHLRLHPLFGDDVIPGTCLRKLPRIINGIPLGPGFLSRDQISEIKWRLVEGGHSVLTFISRPLLKQEAEECKTSLKERLMKHSQAVFGDLTVKVGVILSKCMEFDDDFTLNDIAVEFDEGLQFRD